MNSMFEYEDIVSIRVSAQINTFFFDVGMFTKKCISGKIRTV